jgi:ribosomal protein S18 acetylase RimI-like enzyme
VPLCARLPSQWQTRQALTVGEPSFERVADGIQARWTAPRSDMECEAQPPKVLVELTENLTTGRSLLCVGSQNRARRMKAFCARFGSRPLMKIIVREATKADAGSISSLNTDVQAAHASAVPWFKPAGPDTFPPDAVALLLDEPDNLMFIAEVESSPAGYIYAQIIDRSETSFNYAYQMIYIHHISVRPTHRRQGVGQALLEAVQTAASNRDIRMISLDVWTFNDGARAFFSRSGFTAHSERLWKR